jgi:hypothetical protein
VHDCPGLKWKSRLLLSDAGHVTSFGSRGKGEQPALKSAWTAVRRPYSSHVNLSVKLELALWKGKLLHFTSIIHHPTASGAESTTHPPYARLRPIIAVDLIATPPCGRRLFHLQSRHVYPHYRSSSTSALLLLERLLQQMPRSNVWTATLR